MILLEAGNRLLAEVVRSVVVVNANTKTKAYDSKLYDFDNAVFYVNQPDSNTFTVSLSIPCYKQIEEYGSRAALEKAFGELLLAEPLDGADVTICVTRAQWEGKEEEIVDKISKLKFIALGGIFDYYLSAVHNKTIQTLKPYKVNLRDDTIVYFVPGADRVSVNFELSFIDHADNEIGRVFLTSFSDPSLRRKLQRAPAVLFDQSPPTDLQAFGITTAPSGILGYVQFTLMEVHCSEVVREKAVQTLQSFRNFVQYHLKCAKSYFNSRMRSRVVDFVKVLNRAKLVEDVKPKLITTAGGRTIVNK